jgi:hypothetical protein
MDEENNPGEYLKYNYHQITLKICFKRGSTNGKK